MSKLFEMLHSKLENEETYKIFATKSGENLIVTCVSPIVGEVPFTTTATPEELDNELSGSLELILDTKSSIKEDAAKAAEEMKSKAAEARKKKPKSSQRATKNTSAPKKKEEWQIVLESIKKTIKDDDEQSMRAAIKKLKSSSYAAKHKEFSKLAEELKKKVLGMQPSLLG